MIYNPIPLVNEVQCPNSSCKFNNVTKRQTCEKCGRQLSVVSKK